MIDQPPYGRTGLLIIIRVNASWVTCAEQHRLLLQPAVT